MPDTPENTRARSSQDWEHDETPMVRGALDTIRDDTTSPLTLDIAPPSPKAFRPLPVEQHSFLHRYVTRRVLGQGGMGEVRLCSDLRIGSRRSPRS